MGARPYSLGSTNNSGAFGPGDRVFDMRRGLGTIIEQWGSWLACRYCFKQYGPKDQPTCNCSGDIRAHNEPRAFLVSGAGIYNVRFDDRTIGLAPVNQEWLQAADGVKEVAA